MTKEQQIKIQRCIDEFYFNRPQVRDELGVALQVLYEAEPVKHGRWIPVTKGAMKEIYICSRCHRKIEDDGLPALIPIRYPYCHCGAKMDLTE